MSSLQECIANFRLPRVARILQNPFPTLGCRGYHGFARFVLVTTIRSIFFVSLLVSVLHILSRTDQAKFAALLELLVDDQYFSINHCGKRNSRSHDIVCVAIGGGSPNKC